jgi:hypothetical protein
VVISLAAIGQFVRPVAVLYDAPSRRSLVQVDLRVPDPTTMDQG